MARTDVVGTRLAGRLTLNLVVAVGLAAFAVWAVVSLGWGMLAVGAGTLHALWLLPLLIPLHLLQLLMSAKAWAEILPTSLPLLRAYRLRIIREGIDSLLPVAQVGGEVVGANLLTREGPSLSVAAASVMVDVTVEFLTQLVFLLLGVAALTLISPAGVWQGWLGTALLTLCMAGGLLAAQRFGLLRLLEALARHIAARWPAAGSLTGINDAVAALYRRRANLARAATLHLLAWLLGSVESWAVLHTLGYGVSPLQALIIESLGMAARSAGFAIPGALVVQETGFALAAAAAGLPESTGLSLSLVKRVREVATGLLGLSLWWLERRRAPHCPSQGE